MSSSEDRVLRSLLRKHQAFSRIIARRVAIAAGISCPADVDDLEQASLIGLWKAVKTWEPERGSVTTWAGYQCRAAVQGTLRTLRRGGIVTRPASGCKQVVRMLSFHEESAMSSSSMLDDPWESAEYAASNAERLRSIETAIGELPQSERILFLAHWVDGSTGRALAEDANVTPQAISKKLVRALARVREAANVEIQQR